MSKDKSEPSCDIPSEPNRPQVKIASVKTKIGESRDNLQRRSEWFKQRTTGKK